MKDEVIYKYLIPDDLMGEFTLEIPEGFTVIHIALQGTMPMLWAIIDPKAPLIKQAFKIVSTGVPIGIENGCYLGTYQLYGGQLVRHVFEIYMDEDDDFYSEENEKLREEERLKELKSTEEDVMDLEEHGFRIQKFSDYHYRINEKIDYWPTANKIRSVISGPSEIMFSKPQLIKRLKELLKD